GGLRGEEAARVAVARDLGVAAHDAVVGGEGGDVVALGGGEFARQHIGADDGQAGAEAGQGVAVGGVADQGDAAAGVLAVHPDLADRVEEDVVEFGQVGEHAGSVPAHPGEGPLDDRALGGGVVARVVEFGRGEYVHLLCLGAAVDG